MLPREDGYPKVLKINIVLEIKIPTMYPMLWWSDGVTLGIHSLVMPSYGFVARPNLIVMSFIWVLVLEEWWFLNCTSWWLS